MRHPGRSRGVRLVLAAAWAGAGCRTLVDPPLPNGAVRLTPPAVYARWWAMTEACSGLRRDFGAVAWYVVPGVSTFPSASAPEVNGYYSRPGNEIVLADRAQLDATVVRHEMLHALTNGQAGHPRAFFLERCAGVVACAEACVWDAGPAAPPPAGTPRVPASALRVTAELSPAAPSASRDDGWFTLTVTAANPAPTPVSVALAPGSYAAGFRYEITPDPPPPPSPGTISRYVDGVVIADAGGSVFAAGETKRYVFDFRVRDGGEGRGDRGIPAGRYTFRGAFGDGGVGPWSPAVAGTLSP